MGCHTWFYRKIDVSYEEAKYSFITLIKRELDLLDRMINNRESIDQDLLEVYTEWTPEYATIQIPIWKRMLRMVEGGYCKEAVCRRYQYDTDGVTRYITGKGFYHYYKYLPHDIFRIGNYPKDKLFSLEETLEYLEKNDDIISYLTGPYDIESKEIRKEKAIERLKKFWNENPDGMIDFG